MEQVETRRSEGERGGTASQARPWLTFGAAAAFATLVGVGLAGATVGACGTADRSYYCDSTACYDCDGYGCSKVTASPAPCSNDSECVSGGGQCTSQGCLVACGSSGDCAKGTVCSEGLCVLPGTTVPPTRKECLIATDCGVGKTCSGSVCQACGGTQGPCPCTATSQCGAGLECVSGACTPATDLCKFASECADGQTCADGKCLTTCSAATPCASGNTCDKGVCRPSAPVSGSDGGATGCQGASDCPSTAPVCVAGACTPACTGDPDCTAGGAKLYCNQGACVPDTRPKPNCSGPSDCLTGQSCVGGYCKYRCVDDMECRRVDARIGYCADDKVCRTEAEARPQCLKTADCPSGKTCIGNTCQ